MKELEGLFLISCVFLMFGCKKNIKPNYPKEIGCERFEGRYLMYDPLTDSSYEMVCDCIPSGLSHDNSKDSIDFKNFANRFDFRFQFSENPTPSFLNGSIWFGLEDDQGNRWALNHGFGQSSIDERKSILVLDSLYTNFTLSNAAFYLEDGVPFFECDNCRHYGVKIH